MGVESGRFLGNRNNRIKKLSAAVPATVMFIVLAVLFVFMCLPLGQKTLTATNGRLDLRGENMSGNVFTLDGRWEFYSDQFLTPHDISEYIQPPMTIRVPACWTTEGHELEGFATYRLVITTDNDFPLMLYVPEIYTAYTLWVNGRMIHTAGILSEQSQGSRGLFENALLPVVPQDGVIDMLIQVSNFGYAYGGLPCSLLLGESGPLLSSFFRTRALYCMALGCVLMAAFYHLALYVFRRREITYLYFSLLCVICFLEFLIEKNGLVELLHLIPFDMFGSRIYVLLFCLHSAAVMLFALHVFDQDFLRRRRYAVMIYMLFMLVLFYVMPMNKYYNPIAGAALAPAMLITLVKAVRSKRLSESPWARLYFAAFAFYALVGGAAKIFLEDFMFMTGLLADVFMIMSQSLVLSKEYSRAFELVEETNENLEHIVDVRTKDLQNTNSAMKELIANISHDLKTPVTVISVNLEELSDPSRRVFDEQFRRRMTVAYNTSLDLQRLLLNLLEISRIEAGQSLYRPEPVSLPLFLVSVQDKYGDFLSGKGLSFDIDYNREAQVIIDPQRIWSVFDNVIYNAARYTKQGGIAVTADVQKEKVIITITDTGCGIAAEHLGRIFERFYKALPDRGGNSGDSGLGLYIVKSVMEGIGGSVAIKSELGVGTSIILTFQKHLQTAHTL